MSADWMLQQKKSAFNLQRMIFTAAASISLFCLLNRFHLIFRVAKIDGKIEILVFLGAKKTLFFKSKN